MKDLLTNYADTIVSNIIHSYGADDDAEPTPPDTDTLKRRPFLLLKKKEVV